MTLAFDTAFTLEHPPEEPPTRTDLNKPLGGRCSRHRSKQRGRLGNGHPVVAWFGGTNMYTLARALHRLAIPEAAGSQRSYLDLMAKLG